MERNNFELKKVKLTKNGGLECNYEVAHEMAGENFKKTYTLESQKTPHSDLTNRLMGLRKVVAQVFQFGSACNASLGKYAESVNEDSKRKEKLIKVTGISLSGQDENRGVIITSVFTPESGIPVALNTYRIRYDYTHMGNESDLEGECDAISDEVFAYVYENKHAQLEMAFEDEAPITDAQD